MNLWRLALRLLRRAARPAPKRKPRRKAAPGGFWAARDEAAAARARGAALPPGAPADWLRGVRTGRSRLQSFPPFDVVFDYQDSEGEWSIARRVTVARLEIETFGGEVRPGLLYVHGWCHERRAVRTFRADRMRALHDAVTGEVTDEPRGWLLAQVRDGHD